MRRHIAIIAAAAMTVGTMTTTWAQVSPPTQDNPAGRTLPRIAAQFAGESVRYDQTRYNRTRVTWDQNRVRTDTARTDTLRTDASVRTDADARMAADRSVTRADTYVRGVGPGITAEAGTVANADQRSQQDWSARHQQGTVSVAPADTTISSQDSRARQAGATSREETSTQQQRTYSQPQPSVAQEPAAQQPYVAQQNQNNNPNQPRVLTGQDQNNQDLNTQARAAGDRTNAADANAKLPTLDNVRPLLRDTVDSVLTRGGFDDLVQRFSRDDRDRLRAYSQQNHDDLNNSVAQFQQAWRDKYHHDFRINDTRQAFNDASVKIHSADYMPQAQPAGGSMPPSDTTTPGSKINPPQTNWQSSPRSDLPRSDQGVGVSGDINTRQPGVSGAAHVGSAGASAQVGGTGVSGQLDQPGSSETVTGQTQTTTSGGGIGTTHVGTGTSPAGGPSATLSINPNANHPDASRTTTTVTQNDQAGVRAPNADVTARDTTTTVRDTTTSVRDTTGNIAGSGAQNTTRDFNARQATDRNRDLNAGRMDDRNADKDRGVVTLSIGQGTGEVAVPVVREIFEIWKIDVPNTLDGQTLKANLISRIDSLRQNQASWPADATEAERVVSAQILQAIVSPSGMGAAQPSGLRIEPSQPQIQPTPDHSRQLPDSSQPKLDQSQPDPAQPQSLPRSDSDPDSSSPQK